MRKKLLELRKKRKLTQQQVAKSVGISRAYYARIENGERNPSLSIAFKIKFFFSYLDDDIFSTNKAS